MLLLNVSAGRRSSVTLEKILRFATGTEQEPAMGFTMQPSITFQADMVMSLPRAHTCINRLILPIGNLPASKAELFNTFDLAFSNEYFGSG